MIAFSRIVRYSWNKEPLMDAVKTAENRADIEIDGECPICAANPPFNATTIAAMQEAEDMISGKIPCKWYHSLEEMLVDLHS
jgi:hypothetical protein